MKRKPLIRTFLVAAVLVALAQPLGAAADFGAPQAADHSNATGASSTLVHAGWNASQAGHGTLSTAYARLGAERSPAREGDALDGSAVASLGQVSFRALDWLLLTALLAVIVARRRAS